MIISGIPANISDDALEAEIVNNLYYLGVHNVSKKEISACHRLGKRHSSPYPPRVIVKFINRKIVDKTLELAAAGNWRSIKKEMGHNLRFYSSLSPKNDLVFKSCKKLKEDGDIYCYFIRSGYVMVVEKEGDKPFKILHPQVLRQQYNIDFL